MRSVLRAMPYLILNIIVSAAATLAVLWAWERVQQTGQPLLPFLNEKNASTPGNVQAISGAIKPNRPIPNPEQKVIEIQNVFGVGDLRSEVLVLKRLGEGELWLTNWSLQDEDGNQYVFPDLLLNKDGAVEIVTRGGPDTVIELHWGLESAAWRSGETARLVDPTGGTRASFTIP